MTAKEYLMQLQSIDIKIMQKQQEAAQLRLAVMGHAISYNADRVQTSPENKQEIVITRYIDLEEKISQTISDYISKKDLIIEQIHRLPDPKHIRILYDHYVPDDHHHVKSLERIAADMSYSYIYVCQLHGQALQEFSKMFLTNHI